MTLLPCVFLLRLMHTGVEQSKLPWPFFFLLLWSTLSLSFTDLIACNEFLIQAHIDLHMLTQNGQWGICWKALITSGAWQQLFFHPPFIWRSVTVQMGVIFQLYRVLSPQQASNIESAFRNKKKKSLWILRPGFRSRVKYATWTQEVFYQTSNW